MKNYNVRDMRSYYADPVPVSAWQDLETIRSTDVQPHRYLDRATESLSLRQAAVIELHYVYGTPLSEVADILGLNPVEVCIAKYSALRTISAIPQKH